MKTDTQPRLPESNDELSCAQHWQALGRQVTVATVVTTWGSSPRPVGSHLVVDALGNFAGSVSGGCIEGALVTEALEVIAGGAARLLTFGVGDERAWEVGLSCGGEVQVYVQSMSAQLLEQLQAARAAKRPIALVTRHSDAGQLLLCAGEPVAAVPGFALSAHQIEEAQVLIAAGRSGFLTASAAEIFVRPYLPAARLLIIGAVHIAQSLAPMATLAGYEVTIIDPRSAFAKPERFPGIAVSGDWPDDALEHLQPDCQTAVVTLTHDPKIDDPALCAALTSPAFYVGSLGSKKTHRARCERLGALGFEKDLERIHGPIGLDLGGRAPAEIAVAILAQMILARTSIVAGERKVQRRAEA